VCTASVLCIGISGDTCPQSAAGQLALGSGNVPCAETPDRSPCVSDATRQVAPPTQMMACLLIIVLQFVNRGAETTKRDASVHFDESERLPTTSFPKTARDRSEPSPLDLAPKPGTVLG